MYVIASRRVHLSGVSGGRSRMSLSYGHRCPSVYGGAGGYGTRISNAVSSVFMTAADDGVAVFVANEKHIMQNLNDRLASYLEKVRSLEAANQKLELQIKDFFKKRSPAEVKDLTGYSVTIEDLFKQIMNRSLGNSKIAVEIDNTKLAAKDFQLKYENELSMRMSVEADIAGLKQAMSNMTLVSQDLEMQIKGLNEELAYLKCNHEEEMQLLRAKQSGSVHVEVDCVPPVDLEMVLQEMREQYEAVIQKNHRDAEKWFEAQMTVLQSQITTCVAEVKTTETAVTDLKRTFQTLEIELQGLLTVKGNLEQQLAETSSRYGLQLSQLQQLIDSLEAEFKELSTSIHQQTAEYQLLANIKMRLEMEIAEYRQLLKGERYKNWTTVTTTEATQVEVMVEEEVEVMVEKEVEVMVEEEVEVVEEVEEEKEDEHNPHRQRRVKVIVEEMLDGVVVSSSVEENLQELS